MKGNFSFQALHDKSDVCDGAKQWTLVWFTFHCYYHKNLSKEVLATEPKIKTATQPPSYKQPMSWTFSIKTVFDHNSDCWKRCWPQTHRRRFDEFSRPLARFYYTTRPQSAENGTQSFSGVLQVQWWPPMTKPHGGVVSSVKSMNHDCESHQEANPLESI